jgi:NAD-specific glutamate dehydrogenase
VLLGYTKLSAFQMALETDFPDGEAARPFLQGYFPERLRRSFAAHFPEHVLRREIVTTGAVNHVVNRAGITFLSRAATATGAGVGEVLAAYLGAERETDAESRRRDVRTKSKDGRAEQEGLIEVEDDLEAAVLARFGKGARAASVGKRKAKA